MRAFVAVDAASEEISRLQQDMMQYLDRRDVKPVDPHNLHFTLLFLGEISESQAEQVKDRLSEVSFDPFSLTYTGVGAFPIPDNARVVWVGVDDKAKKQLEDLAGRVHERLGKIGFRPDRPFSAHLTIFRAKNRHVKVQVQEYTGKTFGTGTIDKVHLKKSELSPLGPTYSNVYTISAAKEARK